MKAIKFLTLIICTFAIVSCGNSHSDQTTEGKGATPEREYYGLKIYTFDSDSQVSSCGQIS